MKSVESSSQSSDTSPSEGVSRPGHELDIDDAVASLPFDFMLPALQHLTAFSLSRRPSPDSSLFDDAVTMPAAVGLTDASRLRIRSTSLPVVFEDARSRMDSESESVYLGVPHAGGISVHRPDDGRSASNPQFVLASDVVESSPSITFVQRLRSAPTLFRYLVSLYVSPQSYCTVTPPAARAGRVLMVRILRHLTTAEECVRPLGPHHFRLVQLFRLFAQQRHIDMHNIGAMSEALEQSLPAIQAADELLLSESLQEDNRAQHCNKLSRSNSVLQKMRYRLIKQRILQAAKPHQLALIRNHPDHRPLVDRLPRIMSLREFCYRMLLLNYHHLECFGHPVAVWDEMDTDCTCAVLPAFSFDFCITMFFDL